MTQPKHVTREELVGALRRIAEEANSRASWNYDTLACLKLSAKAEVCDELADILDPPPLPVEAQRGARRVRGL